jgi:hypothetical protein
MIRWCQGFAKLHSGSGPNKLQPQGLKEYSDSYLISDYLGPVLGSKCLVTQTMGNYLRLSQTQTFRGNLGEDVSELKNVLVNNNIGKSAKVIYLCSIRCSVNYSKICSMF